MTKASKQISLTLLGRATYNSEYTKFKSDTSIASNWYWSYFICTLHVGGQKFFPQHTNVLKIHWLWGATCSFVQQITFEPNHFLRSFFQPFWGIFAKWSQTKVELNHGRVNLSLYTLIVKNNGCHILIGLKWTSIFHSVVGELLIGAFCYTKPKVHTETWILEKVLKFAQQFSRCGKSLENRDKVWKNSKKSRVFFF